ncbi:AAA family ATPase [Glycomyces tritici]|uniref:AAA family ATPase n=1 Tax=Glycomyces tritici TaxID=2665176 RepID=A0ABT7YQ67_9ACTN|nr:AAA family ATPase [Glycomyces tritici]MDN3240789.1 AAA family ATPase [Glycomyces tritici]
MDTELAPLYAVSGAPGAGKTSVQAGLLAAGNGLVVMDIDELLEDSALLGVPIAVPEAAPVWPAYGRMWRRIIDMTRRSGHPVVFLSPSIPSELRSATGYLLLDCDDEIRADRLRARGWHAAQVESALRDARAYRPLFDTVVRTDDADPKAVAARILDWTRSIGAAAAGRA